MKAKRTLTPPCLMHRPDWAALSHPSLQCLHWQLEAFKSCPHVSRHVLSSYKGRTYPPVECHLDSATHFYCRKRWTTDILRLSWKRTTSSWLILLAAFGKASAIPKDTQEAWMWKRNTTSCHQPIPACLKLNSLRMF